MKRRLLRLSILLIVFLVAAVVVSQVGSSSPIEQPIAFNHKIHHIDNKIDCTECHLHARDGIKATLPNIDVCGTCHDPEALPEEPAAKARVASVIEYVKSGNIIPWRRLYQIPDHVYFSHRRHATLAKIPCEQCHGEMGSQTAPPPRALKTLTMDDCLECHKEKNATVDCLACHK